MRRRFYYGWLIVAAAGGIEFANAATAIGILTVFVNPMTEEFGWSRTQISGATSLGALLGASLAPFTGRLVDRRGSRLILAAGGVVVALACLYLASVQTLLGFYVAFSVARIADQGLIKIGAPAAAGKWFERYRGRAISLVFFSGSAGIILLAPMVQSVMDVWGWRMAWLLLAVLMFALGVVPTSLVIRRQPEDLGLEVDGAPVQRPAEGPNPTSAASNSPPPQLDWPLRAVIRTPAFWLIMVALFVAGIATSGITLHLVPHLTQLGLSNRAAVGVISLSSASGAVGILGLGFLSDRVSPRLLMGVVSLSTAGAIGVLLTADTLAEAYSFAVLYGVSSGGFNTLAPVLWASYYGRGVLGSIYGLSRAAQVAGFALGPLLLGVVYDARGDYSSGLIYLVFAAGISFVLVLLARRPGQLEPA